MAGPAKLLPEPKTFETPVEVWLCACARAPAEVMAAASTLTALQMEFWSQMTSVALQPWKGTETSGPAGTLFEAAASKWRYDMDFLLGLRGEDQPFPE